MMPVSSDRVEKSFYFPVEGYIISLYLCVKVCYAMAYLSDR